LAHFVIGRYASLSIRGRLTFPLSSKPRIPEPIEFPMDLNHPPVVKPGEKVQLEFSVLDPENGKLIEHFQIVHEKLFYMFTRLHVRRKSP
jgi:hypothetical protein